MIDKATDAIIAGGGVWAALFILAVGIGMGVSIYLGKALIESMNKRIDDNKAMADAIHANTVVLQAQNVSNEARIRAQESAAAAQALTAERQAALIAEVSQLKNEVSGLRNERRS